MCSLRPTSHSGRPTRSSNSASGPASAGAFRTWRSAAAMRRTSRPSWSAWQDSSLQPATRRHRECSVKHSTDRILVSHAGNLPRPEDLDQILAQGQSGRDALKQRLPSAVDEVVDRQIECGVDIVNDGEYVKAGSYTGYMHERVSGWDTRPVDPSIPPKRAGVGARDRRDFPGTYRSGLWMMGSGGPIRPGF